MKRCARRATSHSIDALQVPGTSDAWPPLTQTTATGLEGPVKRTSAPVSSLLGVDAASTRLRYRRSCPGPEVRRAEARLVALGEVSERSKERDWKSRTW